MDYAKKHHSRHNQPATTQKADASAPTARQFYGLDAQTKRCGGNSERQSKISPSPNASDNFLRASFLPKLEQFQTSQPRMELSKMQSQFYKSLVHLTSHYGITSMQTDCFEYPYNFALSLWDAERRLKKQYAPCPEISLMQEAAEFPDKADEIRRKRTSLSDRFSTPSLFEAEQEKPEPPKEALYPEHAEIHPDEEMSFEEQDYEQEEEEQDEYEY